MLAQFLPTQKTNNQNKMNANIPKLSDFPTGEENTAFEKYFTGKSFLATLTSNKDLNVPLSNVTFEPGCRNNWHSHTGGQLLIVVGGEGLYQERGKRARHLKVGDVVEIAPNIEHWHGATAIVGFHIWQRTVIRKTMKILGWKLFQMKNMRKPIKNKSDD